jgi:hypothetical protein
MKVEGTELGLTGDRGPPCQFGPNTHAKTRFSNETNFCTCIPKLFAPARSGPLSIPDPQPFLSGLHCPPFRQAQGPELFEGLSCLKSPV